MVRILKALLFRCTPVLAVFVRPLLYIRRWYTCARYFQEHSPKKLQIGSQTHTLRGWLNTDYELPYLRKCIFLDAVKPFPFPTASLDYIFSEHMIEHVKYDQGLAMLSECYRTLRPGGKLRISTPDLIQVLGVYGSRRRLDVQHYLEWSVNHWGLPRRQAPECFVVNNFMRAWGHQFIYDRDTLTDALRAQGFENIVFCIPGESVSPELAGLESHGENIGAEINCFESMVVEAEKPGPNTGAGLASCAESCADGERQQR